MPIFAGTSRSVSSLFCAVPGCYDNVVISSIKPVFALITVVTCDLSPAPASALAIWAAFTARLRDLLFVVAFFSPQGIAFAGNNLNYSNPFSFPVSSPVFSVSTRKGHREDQCHYVCSLQSHMCGRKPKGHACDPEEATPARA